MNRNYRYGSTSLSNIVTVDLRLQNICHEAIKVVNRRKMYCPDFGISRGFSTPDEQRELFKKGRQYDSDQGIWIKVNPGEIVTLCDGYDRLSPHQDRKAIDFFAIINGRANYEPGNLALIATAFIEAASDLDDTVEWGGNYKSLADGPHIELVG